MAKFEVSDSEYGDDDDDEEYEEEEMENSPPWPVGSSPYVIDLRSPGSTPPELSPAMGSNLALFPHEPVPPHSVVLSSRLSRSASPPQGSAHYGIVQVTTGQPEISRPPTTYHPTDYEVRGEQTKEGNQEMNAQAEDTQTTNQFLQDTYVTPNLPHPSDVFQALPVQSPPQAQPHAQSSSSPRLRPQSQSPSRLQLQSKTQSQQVDASAELESAQPNTLADWLNPEALDEDADAASWNAFLSTVA